METVIIEYLGPGGAVQIPNGWGEWIDAERGAPVEVTKEIAHGTPATFVELPADAKPGAKPEMIHPGTSGLLDQVDSWKLSQKRPTPPPTPTPTPTPQAADPAKETNQ